MLTQSDFLKHVKVGTDYEKGIVRGVWRSYRHVPVDRKVVLDIGAHVGSYSVLAALNGAKLVVAVEPLPRNYELLVRNASSFDVINMLHGAATRKEAEHLWLQSPASFGHKVGNYGQNTVVQHPDTKCILVPTINFAKLVDDVRPYAIKLDCEGSEYDLLREGMDLPAETKYVFGEIHFNYVHWKKQWPSVKAYMSDQGFTIAKATQKMVEGSISHGLFTWARP